MHGQVGTITTVAGSGYGGPSGEGGSGGEGGPAKQAVIPYPDAVAAGPDGSFYFSTSGDGKVRRVSPAGILSIVPGVEAGGLLVEADGSLLVASSRSNRVRRVTATGVIVPVAGDGVAGYAGDGGPAVSARLNSPAALALDSAGNLFISDQGNGKIRRVGRDGVITTVIDALCIGLAVDSARNLYFTVGGGYTPLFKATPEGLISRISSDSSTDRGSSTPAGLATGADDSIYVATNFGNQVLRLGRDGVVSAVAGSTEPGVGDGGPATGRTLNHPLGVAIDAEGNLLIADYLNSRIRKVFINPPKPVCQLTCSATAPLNAALGASVSFTATATASACSISPEVSWNFGDEGSPLSNAKAATHSYSHPGIYNWSLTAVAGADSMCRQTGSIEVLVEALAVSPSRLSFGANTTTTAMSPPQEVTLVRRAGAVRWTATASAPWLAVSPASGMTPAKFTVSLLGSALPRVPGSISGSIRIAAEGVADAPVMLPVSTALFAPGTSAPPYGSLDGPNSYPFGPQYPIRSYSGSVPVVGWALDDIGVDNVKIFRDPVATEPGFATKTLIYIGDATFVPGARPDVEQFHAGTPGKQRAGWGYEMLTSFLPNPDGKQGNGWFKLYAYATDLEGRRTLLGTQLVRVDNERSTTPFGAIDTPRPGEVISGGQYKNSGWVLSPPPGLIPADGSTLRVMVDGAEVGRVNYGQFRSDIATFFPSYLNASNGGGFFFVNATKLPDGMHSLSWAVTDVAGVRGTVGSRLFFVANGVTGALGSPLRRAMHPTRSGAVLDQPCVRLGYADDAECRPLDRVTDLGPVDRLELQLPSEGTGWTGGVRVGEELRPLPVGSALDPESGVFTWQMVPGFLGAFRLEFTHPRGGVVIVPVSVSGSLR